MSALPVQPWKTRKPNGAESDRRKPFEWATRQPKTQTGEITLTGISRKAGVEWSGAFNTSE